MVAGNKYAAALSKAADQARENREISWIEHWRIQRVTTPRVWNRFDSNAQATIGQQVQDLLVHEVGLPPPAAVGDAPEANGEILKLLLDNLPKILAFITQLLALFGA